MPGVFVLLKAEFLTIKTLQHVSTLCHAICILIPKHLFLQSKPYKQYTSTGRCFLMSLDIEPLGFLRKVFEVRALIGSVQYSPLLKLPISFSCSLSVVNSSFSIPCGWIAALCCIAHWRRLVLWSVLFGLFLTMHLNQDASITVSKALRFVSPAISTQSKFQRVDISVLF